MFSNLSNDWTSTKSYATQENLEKALVKANLVEFRPMAVRTPEGRWTAVFAKSLCGNDFMTPAWAGFKVLG